MDTIIRFLKDMIPWKKLHDFLSQLYSHQPYALISAILLLCISLLLGAWYWHRSSEYDEIVRSTLGSNMEATPQNFKGLEAFIFSTLKQTSDVDISNELRQELLHPDFVAACENLQKRLDEYLALDPTKRVATVKVKVAKGKNEGKILTDTIKPGFLFLPIYVLRPTLKPLELEKLSSGYFDSEAKSRIIDPKVGLDAELKEDIALTGYLAQELHNLTSTAIIQPRSEKLGGLIKNTPTQVYVITKNGLNRIFNNQLPDPELYYGTQFSATTFFPSRPYFWPAFLNNDTEQQGIKHQHWSTIFKPSSEEASVGRYFYVTRPYLDLAGNGIVITLARGLIIGGVVQAVLCFDLPYVTTENNVYEILKNGVHRYEGEIVPVVCDMTPGKDVTCEKDKGIDTTPLGNSERLLVNQIGQYIRGRSIPRERSEIAGNLQVLNAGANSDAMHISVPIAADIQGEQQKARLALINLDFIKYKRKTSFIAAASFGSFGLMIILLTYLWGATVRSKREYQEAFSQVAKVMYKSPTPYVRLDSKDTILDCSLSFCQKLGYPPNENSVKQMQKHTFRSLCADEESIEQYKNVQESRKGGQKVDPYSLRLRGKNDKIVSVVVRSAAVPSPSRSLFPETFGILLNDEKASLQPLEPPLGDDSSGNVRQFNRA
ncbi:MAG: PAS domain-containing protein [Acidobacteriota bacterium]